MKEQGQGKIVNIASAVAFSGVPYFVHYATSKGGIISFTRAMAKELGEYNIKVNVVAPGLILTQASLDMMSEEELKRNVASKALKRPLQAENVVGAVLFLASPDSDFITGQTIVVDGGGILH
jgi:NAD(P)-dependent dehydrogenase (short-subunit alcohol dehydrogenase family)